MSERPTIRVLFDGECGLCARTVRFLFAREATARFVFTPMMSPLGQTLARGIGLDPADPSSFAAILPGGEARIASRGMFRLLMHCRNPWPAFAVLAGALPVRLTDAVYGAVARRRIRFFGRSDICQRPEPGLASRLELDTAR